LQYHFFPKKRFRPYIGAGINFTIAYAEEASNSLETALGGSTDVEAGNSVGWAVQAGIDYDLDDRWFLNLDIKYVAISVDADIVTGATKREIEVDINPVIIGAGIGYRF
jgi:outer membrane protein